MKIKKIYNQIWRKKMRLMPYLFLLLLLTTCTQVETVVKPPFIIIKKAADILPIEGDLIKPVIYFNEFNFDQLAVKKKKQKFIDMLVPSILIAKHNIEIDRKKVADIISKMDTEGSIDEQDSIFMTEYLEKFKAKDPEDLYYRLATHPTSIVLAQAAVESGWGSSRFFRKANNLFGIWSYNKKEKRIKASQTRAGRAIYVRRYSDISSSIADYFRMLASASAYKSFRQKRTEETDPYKLTYFLKNYSELNYTYVSRLNLVIRKNKLARYDSVKLDPNYYVQGEKIELEQ